MRTSSYCPGASAAIERGMSQRMSFQGNNILICEQSGAEVHVPSNAAHLLERWGVGPFLADKTFEPSDIILRRWEDGRPIGNTRLIPDFRESFGAPYYVVHRVHFHEVLYERAKELGVDVRVNSKVVKYDLKAPAVMLEGGKISRADLVVAADGVNSTARRLVLGGKDQVPKPSGFYSYKAAVPVEKIRADLELAELAEFLDKPSLNLWVGPCGHVMTYTTAAGSIFNMVLSRVDKPASCTARPESDVEKMRREFSNWDPK